MYGTDSSKHGTASHPLQCGTVAMPIPCGSSPCRKSHPAAAIRAAAELGQRDFGENYVQEALPKLAELADLPLTWHFIGQLQANKTRDVAEHFHWVHTLDRERIAVRLSEQRGAHAPPLNVCIQVQPGR